MTRVGYHRAWTKSVAAEIERSELIQAKFLRQITETYDS